MGDRHKALRDYDNLENLIKDKMSNDLSFPIVTLPVNETTPVVKSGVIFVTANTETTSYTDFLEPPDDDYEAPFNTWSKMIFILVNDEYTSFTNDGSVFADSTKIWLSGGTNLSTTIGDIVTFIHDGTRWRHLTTSLLT